MTPDAMRPGAMKRRARALAGHLILEIILGAGFAAVAFTGIAVQVSNAKQSDTRELAQAQFAHSIAQVVDEVRSGALREKTSHALNKIDFHIELIDADEHLYRLKAKSRIDDELSATIDVVRRFAPNKGQP